MHLSTISLLKLLLVTLVAQTKSYPMQTWPMYSQMPREYTDDEYYYSPKIQYYYDAPAMSMPGPESHVPAPYYYDPYSSYVPNEEPKEQEERLAALPIGQETWFETDTTPRWRSNDVDDVSAAFLDNLILTQMAQDAQRRRENSRAAFPPVDYEERDVEDEDVRELKALAGKPLYHVPKTAPKYEDEEDYPADDGFINWNGFKRSVTTAAPTTTTHMTLNKGQDEVVVPRPSQTHNHHNQKQFKRGNLYDSIAQLLKTKSTKALSHEPQQPMNERRIEKRFIAGDSDLVLELRGLKQRIRT